MPKNKHLFKSRLTFKAISEIFKMVIKRELVRMGVNRANMSNLKEELGKQTKRMAEHSIRCRQLIERHS